MDVLLLIVGLTALWYGTNLTIAGAVSIAGRFGISEFIVGIAVLSIGSDLPELAIAIDAGIKNLDGADFSGVVTGSAVGSSLGQIGFVLGTVGLLSNLTLPRRVVINHGVMLLGSVLLLALIGYDGSVSRTEGLALLVVYFIYFAAVLTDVQGGLSDQDFVDLRTARAILYLVAGLILVVASAELTVSSAVAVAGILGVSDTFVAVVLVGLGTSLPELSISLGAIARGHRHLSVGNIIGSNVFDTLVPVGAAAVIAGLSFDRGLLLFEVPVLFVLSALVLLFFLRKRGIRRTEAGVILAVYVIFVLTKIAGFGA